MAIKRLYLLRLALLLLPLLLVVCSQPTTGPDPVQAVDCYTISLPSLHQDSLFFTYTAAAGNRFILPLHYFDNPVDSLDGELLRELVVIDGNGANVDTMVEIERIGAVTNRIAVLPETVAYPVTFIYRINFSAIRRDSASGMIPAVHFSDSSLFMVGAYFLIIPQVATSLTTLWRAPHQADITVETGPGITLRGIPSQSFSCRNIYELLFLQLTVAPSPVAAGRGGGVDFVYLDFSGNSYQSPLIDSLTTAFSTILDDIASRYGPFSGAPYTVSIQGFAGGLEGTCGFCIRSPAEDPDVRFAEILAHEALHHFIGIRCGDVDDPWWKESAATWLALETVLRLGLYDKEAVRRRMTKRFDAIENPEYRVALSDPLLRSQLFGNPPLFPLVYDRGSQVMMLLDLNTRRGSNNRSTLHHVTADLCGRFAGSAFTRGEMLSAFERYGARDAAAILATYVDDPDSVMPAVLLKETFEQLEALDEAW